MSSTQYLQLPAGKIAYQDHPSPSSSSSKVILCIPGMGDLQQSYRHLLPLLTAEGYRVITLDIRGTGESDTTFPSYSASDVGEDVIALINHLNLSNLVITGNSMAAGSAVYVSSHLPTKISSLISTGPFIRDVPINPIIKTILPYFFARPYGWFMWDTFYSSLYKSTSIPSDHKEYCTLVSKAMRKPGHLQVLQKMLSASKSSCEDLIPSVKSNTSIKSFVLMGSKDPDFPDPLAEAKHIEEVLGAEVRIVDGAGHYPHVEFPEEFMGVVRGL